MKSKVLENKKMKEKALLDSALKLFTQNDIHSVTVQDIVEEAHVAKGTFYLYFKDKYQLRDVLIQRESSKLFLKAHLMLEDNDIQNFEDAVIFVINQVLLELEHNPIIMKFIEKNLSWGIFHQQLQSTLSNGDIDLVNKFTALAKKSGYYFKKPDVILFIIIETVGSTSYNSILYQRPLPFDEYKPYLFEVIRAILKNYKDA